MGRIWDLFLINRTQHRWQEGHATLQRTIAAIFEETLSWWLWRSKLRCGLTQKRPCNEELSTASGQQMAKKWRPQVVYKEPNAASNHVSMELNSSSGASSSGPSLSWPLDYSFAEDAVKPCETPNLIAFKNKQMWTSLVVHQLGSHLPKEVTQVQSLVWEDSMCQGAAKPMCHNYWAHAPQQEKPPHWEAHAPQWRAASAHHN